MVYLFYFAFLSIGFCAGFVFAGVFAAGKRADLNARVGLHFERATRLDKANLVLRRELAELRATYEAPRDHGYGATHG